MGYFVIAGIFVIWIGWSLNSRKVNALWFLMWIDFVELEVDRDLNPFWYWFGIVTLTIVVAVFMGLGFLLR